MFDVKFYKKIKEKKKNYKTQVMDIKLNALAIKTKMVMLYWI